MKVLRDVYYGCGTPGYHLEVDLDGVVVSGPYTDLCWRARDANGQTRPATREEIEAAKEFAWGVSR